MKRMLYVLLFLCCNAVLFAQYAPGDGTRIYNQYLSPQYLGLGVSAARAESVFDAIINPALNAKIQRIHLQGSYAALIDGNAAANGHAVNFGIGIPAPVGVFFTSGHFLNADSTDISLGNSGTVHFAFSKAISDAFWFGTGFRVQVGGKDNYLDWGLGMDIGMAYTFPMKHIPYIRLGLALRHIGYWYNPQTGVGGMPEPFTLVFGSEYMFLNRKKIAVALNVDISLPTFQGLRTDFGLLIRIFDIMELATTWQFDLDNVLQGSTPMRSWLPGFGLAFHIPLAKKKNKRSTAKRPQIDIRTAAMPLRNNNWLTGVETVIAFGQVDRKAPDVTIGFDENNYYNSPNNDGVKDLLTVDLSITDERYVKNYRMDIYNADNRLVKSISNPENRIENQVKNFFKRFFAADKGILIPPTLLWDGVEESGEAAVDGEYYFRISAEDDNKNVFLSDPYPFIIDRKKPELELTALRETESIFSPNGDQQRDTITFEQSGSREMNWQAVIRTSEGKEVRTFLMQDEPLTDIVWNGQDNSGITVPDGVYTYTVVGTDYAGNNSTASLSNIIVRTDPTPISLHIDRQYFSPNSDNRADTLTLSPQITNLEGIVTWSIDIRDTQGQIVREYQNESVVREISFDGRNNNVNILPDGEYQAYMKVFYVHGNRPEAVSPPFIVDTQPPSATLQSMDRILSPNGDGVKDEISFTQQSSQEYRWVGEIVDEKSEVVHSKVWSGGVQAEYRWDGRLPNGKVAPDGTYIYQLSSTDKAENTSSVQPIRFTIDTSTAAIIISPEYTAFSPNKDKKQDSTFLFLRLADDRRAIERYECTINTLEGSVIRRFSGNEVLPETLIWDGRNDASELVPDGLYRAKIQVTLLNGVKAVSSTQAIEIDTAFPEASISIDNAVFSPDGDGRKDLVIIRQSSSVEKSWNARIISEDNTVVRTFNWSGISLSNLSWDGSDENGNILPDAHYQYIVESTDLAGNTFRASPLRLQVDTRPASIFLTADKHAIAPSSNDDGQKITFNVLISDSTDIEKWKFAINTVDGRPYYHEEGSEAKNEMSFLWNGTADDGRIHEGLYIAQFSVEYIRGNKPESFTPQILIDSSPPVADVSLTPLPFSPDNDGENDVLIIGLEVGDVSDIDRWQFSIYDRNNTPFQSFSGKGLPTTELSWDGRSKDGELVISAEDYPYDFEISDVLGNKTVVSGIIPVDILVIKQGDQYKVQISSIYFEANSPELYIDDSDPRRIKNREILTRLAEVFKKYSSYNILIEGHAVNISGTIQEEENELAQLSYARAVNVQAALTELGIQYNRLTVAGRGGTEPLVPHTDLEQRWKNRRVEFILLK